MLNSIQSNFNKQEENKMNKFNLILLPVIILFLGCATKEVKITTVKDSEPNWFYTIKPTNKNEIIGYGIAQSLVEAKKIAMSDIVKSISIKIQSSANISKSSIDGIFNTNISTNLQTKSAAILSGVKFIKTEQIGKLWYVSAKYNNAPLELKIKALLPQNIKIEKQNNYLKNTRLFKKINKEIGISLNYQIIRKDNLWQIKYNDILLPINQDNFYKLFSNYKENKFFLETNKTIYKENDEMYFNLYNQQDGYISILYVEHNGKVGVLLANKSSNKPFKYPDLKSEDTFKVVNPYNKPIQELYIALYSKNKIDLSEFENISDNLLDESNHNFHILLNKLNNYRFSTYTVKIK